MVFTVQMFGFLIFEPTFGWISDKFSQKKIIMLMSLAYSLGIFIFTQIREFWQFYPVFFFLSATMSGLTVTAPASLSKTVSKSKRGRGYGMFMAVWSLGQLIGPLIGGYLAETTNYTVPFYVSSVIALIIPVMALRLKEKKNQSKNKVLKSDGEAKESLFDFGSLKIFASASFILIFLTNLMLTFNMSTIMNILPIYAQESVKFLASEMQIGIMMALAALASIPVQFTMGTLSDKIGRIPIIVSSFLLGGLTLFAFFIIEGVFQLYLVRIILTVCSAAIGLCLMVLLIDIVPKGRTGIGIGLYYIGGDLGAMLGPLIVGVIYDLWSFESSIYLLAAIWFIAVLITFYGFKKRKTS
jgi:DHA1 family multidrug resistance protein-like MFS transporter